MARFLAAVRLHQLEDSSRVFGPLAAGRCLLDPADHLAGRVGLERLEHELVGVFGHPPGGHLELCELAGVDGAALPGDALHHLGDLLAMGLEGWAA